MMIKHLPSILFLGITLVGGVAASAADTALTKTSPAGRTIRRIDAKKSRFIVETQTSGLATMFGHDHKMEFGEYTGTASYVSIRDQVVITFDIVAR